MLATVKKPGKDEAMPSWMDYLLSLNGGGTDKEKAQLMHAMLGYYPKSSKTKLTNKRYLPYLEDICKTEEKSQVFPSLNEALELHTDLFALLPFLSDGEQARRFEYCLHGSDNNMTGNCGWNITWHYCPECVKEDMEEYGRPLIHIGHQLYADACWKHGCKLSDTPDDMESRPASAEQLKKAKFMHDLYVNPLISSFDRTSELIMEACEKMGVSFAELCKKSADAGYITVRPITFNTHREPSGTDGFLDVWTGLAAWLYGTADEFRAVCTENIGRSTELLSLYTCPSCGHTYYMHPVAYEYGAPCPECAKKMTDNQILARYAERMNDGTYRILEMDHKIRIFHECGKEIPAFKRNIWKRKKCKYCELARRMENHTGEKSINHDGKEMTIISYKYTNNVTVRFEDGETKRTSYYRFVNGLVKRPNTRDHRLEDRTGEVGVNAAGQQMKIVKYRNARDIDVMIGDRIAKHRTYLHFKRGEIAISGHLKDWAVGETRENTQGIKMKVIAYRGAKDIDVEFETGEIVTGKRYEAFKNGKIRCPSNPS